MSTKRKPTPKRAPVAKRRRVLLGSDSTPGGKTSYAGIERKIFAGSIDTATPGATWAQSETTLVAPTQGTAVDNRLGNKITVRNIMVRGWIYLTGDVPNTEYCDLLRLVLVQDKQPNGAAPAVTDVFDSDEIHGLWNMDNRQRFRVHADKTYRLKGGDASGADLDIVPVHFELPMKVAVTYKGNAGTVADIATNNFFIYICTWGGNCTVDLNWEVDFTDQ